jgi:glycosyltransferase involved in cell wall biosynthesis
MPMLSVITPTLNRHQLLENALACLAEQTFQDFELIVVNDGGESILSVIKKWDNKLNIRPIELAVKGGPSAARNRGIELSKGKYLSFLDDDDFYLPGHFDNLIQILEKDNLDFVYSGTVISAERLSNLPENLDNCIIMDNEFNPSFLYVMCYLQEFYV